MPSIEEQLKDKVDQLGSAFEQFKKANDQEIKSLKEKGHVDPTLADKVTKANEDVGRLDNEIKELRTALNRKPMVVTAESEKEAARFESYKGAAPFLFKDGKFSRELDSEYKEAHVGYLRRGLEGKALSVGSDPNGGYLVRPEVGEMIQTKIFETSPFRQYMGQVTIGTDAFEAPTDGDEAGGAWVGEMGTRSATDTPKIGMLRIPAHELMASPKATQKLLDDASVNIEQWLGQKAANKFLRMENDGFANGNGVEKPRGFLSYAAGTGDGQIEQVALGGASAPTADGIIDLEAALKSAYKADAVWFAARATFSAVRKLKDSVSGQYLWQPGLQAGNPTTLLGHPVAEAADMPAVQSNALAIAFGNFRVGYLIVDRIGIRLLRDPFTAKPFVQFDYTKRVGGDVVVHEAIKIGKITSA
jgi:HK97 family phage major capsid protein